MKIIQLDHGDIEMIKPLWEQLNRQHQSLSETLQAQYAQTSFEERMQHVYEKDLYTVFAAKEGRQIIGYCMASIKSQTGEIDSIFIAPAFQRDGIGLKLMETAEAWLEQNNVKKIILGVAAGNEQVIPFYEKQGYLPRVSIFQKIPQDNNEV